VEGHPAGPPANGAHRLADSAPPAREVHETSILRQPIEPVIARWLATGLTVDRKRCLAARSDGVEGRHPPTERPGRKARCGRWQLTGSVAWPQGRMAWKADTRRQKDLAARQGVDVGSWPSVLPRPQGRAHVRRLAGSVSEPTHGWWCYWCRFAVRRPGRWQAIRSRGGKGAACPFRCPGVIEWSPRP